MRSYQESNLRANGEDRAVEQQATEWTIAGVGGRGKSNFREEEWGRRSARRERED